MTPQKEILYLNPLELNGPEQMAIDLFLLEKSFTDKNFNMAIRFYTWNGDWLSIGKNQKELPKTCLKLLKNEQLKIVRRPSGGQTVLHSRGLTYALIWKDPPKNKKESYYQTAQWLKDGFKKAGVDLFFGDQAVNTSNSNCFATATSADLVDKNKYKNIGSAQYWKRGHLLQHGEILLEPSKLIWKEIFKTDPPNIKNKLKEKDLIINYLKESLIKTWPNLNLCEYELNKTDKEMIKNIARDNFERTDHF